ncbi:alpha/beta fold hydrolase [Reichenbachiella sp. MALMAid0571]|uniref:alpha/beta hydrolase n=1 Tax=Reichenbachiella sp. MALMAid0571 TaxID=3143939 RepID=UPI0032E012D6
MRFLFFPIFLSLVLISNLRASDLIRIKSGDGVEITADLYKIHPDTVPFIILFHQAGWSRGEYLETAPKLNALGYNCLAVDLRSGKSVNGVENFTFVNANKALKETKYIDAYQDIEASIAHVKKFLARGKVIILGSSYSSSLVLKYAGDNPKSVNAVVAFSPGEYFKPFGKPADFIQSSAVDIQCPSLILSARAERNSWWNIYEAINTANKSYYLPETSGNHGSRALWQKFTDHKGYWEALTDFLSRF